MQGAMENTNYT